MPIHDWTRVPAGLFHHFHQDWSVELARALNSGRLPKGLYAFVEQRVGGPEPDVIAVETRRNDSKKPRTGGNTAIAERPQTRLVQKLESDASVYARKANRVTIRHQLGDVIAVIEIVSPGNKSNKSAVREFVAKAIEFLKARVHMLIVDLFPPTPRDEHGIHGLICDEFGEEPAAISAEQPLVFASYDATPDLTAFIETAAVGEPLPEMPLFVGPGEHIRVPLDATYTATWNVTPEPIREMVLGLPQAE